MEKKDKGKPQQTNTDVKVEITEYRDPISHGENTRYYRNMKRFSQEYMAAKLGISQPKYSEIERSAVIDDETLSKIANILNIGLEWLKEIPILKGTTIYNQDGNGTNFQNTGDVNYTIQNPVEEIKEAYTNTIEILERNFDKTLRDKDRRIETLEERNNDLLDRLINNNPSIK